MKKSIRKNNNAQVCVRKHIKSCTCGSSEFITTPNRYDIYKIIGGRLELTNSPFVDDMIKLYCRECGEELLNAVDFISQ
ncbi:MAG: hypothetical protein LBU65_04110 [Planctomycetaceae bacterium]|jgi:rRNA maturation protein Nop10|nr:hypothetical protein [Planctomycetaceae bacterium]